VEERPDAESSPDDAAAALDDVSAAALDDVSDAVVTDVGVAAVAFRLGSSPSWTRRARTPKTAAKEARAPAAKRRGLGARSRGMDRASTAPLNRP
jgi:hypothetical protein